MDFLNKTASQLNDLWRSMTPGTRTTAGLLLLIVVLSLGYLVRYPTSGPDEYLLGGRVLSQRDLTAMSAAFSTAGLKEWEIEGNRLKVPRGQRSAYLAALADENALPEEFGTAFEEMIAAGSWFESREQRQWRHKHATQKGLALVLSQMKGIETAEVIYDEETRGGLHRGTEKRATIVARADGNRSLTEEQIHGIRETVVGAIGGLNRENVIVTDLNTSRAHITGSGGNPSDATANVYAANKRMFEKAWREEIYNLLSMYPGIVVGVNVELDPETRQTTNNPIEHQAASATQVSPQGQQNGAADSRGSHSTNAVSDQAALIPTRVRASISVPNSYFEQVWLRRHERDADATANTASTAELSRIEAETKTNIQQAVLAMLPTLDAAQDSIPQVTVTTHQDLPLPTDPRPTASLIALAWLSHHWQSLALAVVALCSLLVLRGIVRSSQDKTRAAPKASDARTEPAAAEDTPSPSEPATDAHGRVPAAGLQNELTVMVKEDPDAAANVLRNWLGDAA